MIKVIAIGNILLSDDGIGIKVAEAMKEVFMSFSQDISVIIGETDIWYCLDNIETDDLVIVIDSTYFQIEPGTVSRLTLEQCDKFRKDFNTAHGENLINILRQEYRELEGYLIGIEIAVIDYSLELSHVLRKKFPEICSRVSEEIQEIVTGWRD